MSVECSVLLFCSDDGEILYALLPPYSLPPFIVPSTVLPLLPFTMWMIPGRTGWRSENTCVLMSERNTVHCNTRSRAEH